MKRWKYHLLYLAKGRKTAQVEEAVNELGHDGWELVTVIDAGANAIIFIFKQPAE